MACSTTIFSVFPEEDLPTDAKDTKNASNHKEKEKDLHTDAKDANDAKDATDTKEKEEDLHNLVILYYKLADQCLTLAQELSGFPLGHASKGFCLSLTRAINNFQEAANVHSDYKSSNIK